MRRARDRGVPRSPTFFSQSVSWHRATGWKIQVLGLQHHTSTMFSSLAVLAALVALLNPVSSVQTESVQTFTSGPDGLLVTGPANSLAGNSVAQIGDYNGDGIDDFAVGSMLMTINAVNRAGLTLIVLGRTGSWPATDLSTATSGASTRRVYGSSANVQSGSSVGGAGDVNGDGFADVVIGAYGVAYNGINGGAVFVIFGSAGPYTDVVIGNSFTASASVGYAIYGAVNSGPLGQLTSNTRGVGDINNDGVDDFAISAYAIDYASRSDAGSVWVIFGSKAAPSNIVTNSLGSKGVLFGGAGSLNYAGYSIDGAGDFNSDGIPDLIFGANGYSPVISGVTRSLRRSRVRDVRPCCIRRHGFGHFHHRRHGRVDYRRGAQRPDWDRSQRCG